MPAGNEKLVEKDTQSESTTTSLNFQDETVKIAQDAASDGDNSASAPAQQNRKLKRISRTSGNSRFAKLSEDRRQEKRAQKQLGTITKPEDLIGVELADGRYKVVGRLGKGSMAYVLRAKDSRLETDVVVKIPKPEKLAGDEIRDRFRRESQLLVRLAHPHVVKVLDVGEYEQVPYVVMQLLSGGTLTDKMDDVGKSRQMPPESLKQWVREVARALDFCAKQGTVHRDVKPANILFDTDDNAYVSDFGLTKIMYGEHTALNSSETTTGVVLGTPNYIAPEIVQGNAYDGRADQYSLGITVYHTLFGRAPMQGNSATLTMINQTQKHLQLLSDVRSDVSRELALVIRQSIEKDPAKRFETCEEFAEAVIDALRGSSASSIAPAPTHKQPAAATKPKIAAKKKPAKRSANASGKKQRSARVAEAAAFNNYLTDDAFTANDENWLDPGLSAPPPRKNRTKAKSTTGTNNKKKKKKKSKKASSTKGIVVFGMDVHPGILIGGGIFSVLLLLFSILSFSSSDAELGSGGDTTIATGSGAKSQAKKNGSGNGNRKNAVVAENKQANNPRNAPPQNSNESVGSQRPPQTAPKVAGQTPVTPISSSMHVVDSPQNVDAAPSQENSPDLLGPIFDSIPFSPGDRITVGLPDHTLMVSGRRIWDKTDGSVRIQLSGDYQPDAYTTLSPDGRWFAVAAKPTDQQNNSVTVWDTQTGEQIFTAAGDSKRYADVILLSSDTLFVGDRWSNELLTWKCETGKKSKPIKIQGATFKQGNVALSNDGEYLAAVAQGRLVVVSARDGKLVVVMGNPNENPVGRRTALTDAEMKIDQRRQNAPVAEPVFASLQSLRFSPDNLQLAGFSNYPRSRMICWNKLGNIISDNAAFTEYSHPGYDAALQWFGSRDAWLVADQLIEKGQGRVVLTGYAGGSASPQLRVYDDEHLVGVLPNSPSNLSLVPIPWDDIQGSLEATQRPSSEAILSSNSTVSIELNLDPFITSNTPESGEVYRAFRQGVMRDGIKIDKNQPLIFRIRTATSGDATPILSRLQPSTWARNSYPAQSDKTEYVIAELHRRGNEERLWKINLGSVSELSGDGRTSLNAEELRRRIESLVFPYFIPAAPTQLGLPIYLH